VIFLGQGVPKNTTTVYNKSITKRSQKSHLFDA